MSLKTFHIVFITLSSLTCFGFAAWLFAGGAVENAVVQIGGGIVSVLLGASLVVYGRKFLQKFRHISYM